MVLLKNGKISVGFQEQSGTLVRLFSKETQTEFLGGGAIVLAAPFVIWYDFYEDYHFEDYQKPGDPAIFSGALLTPQCDCFESSAEGWPSHTG